MIRSPAVLDNNGIAIIGNWFYEDMLKDKEKGLHRFQSKTELTQKMIDTIAEKSELFCHNEK